jgi:hypothetical protein
MQGMHLVTTPTRWPCDDEPLRGGACAASRGWRLTIESHVSPLLRSGGAVQGSRTPDLHSLASSGSLPPPDVRLIGRCDGLRERYYAVTTERRITHSALTALVSSARAELHAPITQTKRKRSRR